MEGPLHRFEKKEQSEEEFDSPPWEAEFDEEQMVDRQDDYGDINKAKPSDEWMEIVDTEEGLDAEPLKVTSPYDDLEEPFWEHEEEDQKRVDDARKLVNEHLDPSEQDEEKWSPPNSKAEKKKKKKKEDKSDKKDKNKKVNAKSKHSTANVSLTSVSSVPMATATQSQKKLPNEQKKPPPLPPAKQSPPPIQQPAPVPVPAPVQTDLPAARPPHTDKPGAPIALPIASQVPEPEMPTNSLAIGYSQDLGGLGQIGVFSSDGGHSHLNHRMDSFTVLLAFMFVVFYTRTSY